MFNEKMPVSEFFAYVSFRQKRGIQKKYKRKRKKNYEPKKYEQRTIYAAEWKKTLFILLF